MQIVRKKILSLCDIQLGHSRRLKLGAHRRLSVDTRRINPQRCTRKILREMYVSRLRAIARQPGLSTWNSSLRWNAVRRDYLPVNDVPDSCSAYRPYGHRWGLFWPIGRAPGQRSSSLENSLPNPVRYWNERNCRYKEKQNYREKGIDEA